MKKEKNIWLNWLRESTSSFYFLFSFLIFNLFRYVSLSEARDRKLKLDFSIPPAKPSFLGTKVFKNYPIQKLVDYIDWNPFFHVWQLRGKYPNRNYPKLFDDADVGAEAKKVFEEGQLILNRIINENLIEAHGIIGFYPCNAVGMLYNHNNSQKKKNSHSFFLR